MEHPMELKRYFDVAWRRKWWVVVPAVLAVAASLVLVAVLPNVYRASTIILVTRQSVPDDIVRSTVTLRIEERMKSLQVQIFSRTYLEQIAREFGMIPPGAREAEIEATYRSLRAQIIPEVDNRDFSWFRISVDDVNPQRAAGIANRLAGLFIEQNSRMRASQATGTLEATEGWETKYRSELAARDKEIAAFKELNIYELPDQQPVNLQLLDSAERHAMELTSEIQLRTDRLAALRSQHRAQREIDAVAGAPAQDGADDVRLAKLQREVKDLLEVYTEENPVVKRKRDQVAELVAALAVAPSGVPTHPSGTTRLGPSSEQIVAMEDEIKGLERDRAREAANIAIYRGRVANAPQHQQRLLELTRDYDTVKQQFDTVVSQKEHAQRAQDLEESKKGEQFQIQDFAYAPAVPYKPSLLEFLMTGLGLGVALGVGAVLAKEAVDQTVRSEAEFSEAFADLPVFGVIPNLDVASRSRSRSFAFPRVRVPQVASILRLVVLALIAFLA